MDQLYVVIYWYQYLDGFFRSCEDGQLCVCESHNHFQWQPFIPVYSIEVSYNIKFAVRE